MSDHERETDPGPAPLPHNGLVELEAPFLNAAGSIQNIVNDHVIRCVSVIHSKAGSVRSNHYHKTDAHWLYVVSGEMVYEEAPIVDGRVDRKNSRRQLVKAGECVFTGPMVWHRTEFLAHTVLISASLRPRDTENHEADLVRVTE